MLTLQPSQERRLRGQSVQVDFPDANTLILRDVPIEPGSFNKPRTNVLLKRPNPGMPFLVGVDEDLEYEGTDPVLIRSFSIAPKRDGWRIVPVPNLDRDLSSAVDRTLVMLGNPAGVAPLAASRGLLDTFGADLTAALDEGLGELTCGREEELETILATLIGHGQVRLPIVSGKSGVGKTNLLWAVARRLQTLRPAWRLVVVDLPGLWSGTMFEAERERLFAALLDEARRQPGTVLGLEMLGLASFGHCALQVSRALDQGLRMIGTSLLHNANGFRAAPLARRTVVVSLGDLTPAAVRAALESSLSALTEAHGVTVSPDLLNGCVNLSRSLPGHDPARALALLDAGLSRAVLSGNESLSLDDLSTAARQFKQSRNKPRL